METRLDRAIRNDIVAGVPVAGFTGVNGAGKTLLAVRSALCDLARGRVVYSTVPIRSKYGDSRPIRSLRELPTLHDATILLDEVSVIFSSRSSMSLPAEIVALIQTLRHRNLTIRWTAPAWARCDNLLREVTQGVVNVIPLLRKRGGSSPWPTPRVVMAGLMDTTTGKTDETPTKVMRRRVYFPTKLPSFGAYDSLADTPLLGRHLQSGVCVDCGGTMTRPKHDEHRHELLGLPWFADDSLRAPFTGEPVGPDAPAGVGFEQ